MYLIYNAWRCGYQIKIELPLQSLLNYLKVKQSKETTSETKAQCYGCLLYTSDAADEL